MLRIFKRGLDWTPSGNAMHLQVRHSWGGYSVLAVAFSPNGELLATGCGDGKVRLLTTAGEVLHEVKLGESHDRAVRAVAFSPNGELLATCCSGKLQLLTIAGEVLREVLHGDSYLPVLRYGDLPVLREVPHGCQVNAVAFSPNGELLATGCCDGKLRLLTTAGEVLHE